MSDSEYWVCNPSTPEEILNLLEMGKVEFNEGNS